MGHTTPWHIPPYVLKTLITLPSVRHTGHFLLLLMVAVHLLQQHMCPHFTYTISEGALRHTTHTPAPLSAPPPPLLPPARPVSASQTLPPSAVLPPCCCCSNALRTRSRAWCSRQRRMSCRVAFRTTRKAPTPPRHHANVCLREGQQAQKQA